MIWEGAIFTGSEIGGLAGHAAVSWTGVSDREGFGLRGRAVSDTGVERSVLRRCLQV